MRNSLWLKTGLISATAFTLLFPLYWSLKENPSRFLSSPDPEKIADENYTVHSYAKECEAELGKIPTFNCLDGQIVPVYNSDSHEEITDKTFKDWFTQCDHPSLLRTNFTNWIGKYNPCVPFMRVGTPKAEPGFDTQWVWTCRRYFVRPKEDIHFDDINMIGHNPKTGATCFFVSSINRTDPSPMGDKGHDGTKVPEILSEEGLTFWSSPKKMNTVSAFFGGSEKCVKCHDNDPFIHSPFISQLKKENGKPLIPSNPDGLYYVVGSRYFNHPDWNIRHLVSEEAKACTKCHRIGDRRSCDDFALWAVGEKGNPHVTKAFRRVPWMPAKTDDWHEEMISRKEKGKPLDKKYLDAVKFIHSCCDNPKKKGCEWEKLDRPNLKKSP